MTADQVRAAMPPEMRAVCDALRGRFGARLVYLETPSLTLGRDVDTGDVEAKESPK